MKSILISIQPQWVGKILNGDKTIEIRKTMPKCELPCKVYVYCTKEKSYMDRLVQNYNGYWYTVSELVEFDAEDYGIYSNIGGINGEVVAEFTLSKVDTYDDDTIHTFTHEDYSKWVDFKLKNACIHEEDFENYASDNWLYGWHISDLKIYDEPKELSEFKLNRAPQSWCYVEEV